MPKKSKDKSSFRFQMDTATFCHIWNNHVCHPTADGWKNFVCNLFDRFTEASETTNINSLNSNPETEGWNGWDDEQKYEFLSEKAYTKCMNIRKRVRDEGGGEIPMPDGYLLRKGAKKGARISTGEIASIFGITMKSQ